MKLLEVYLRDIGLTCLCEYPKSGILSNVEFEENGL